MSDMTILALQRMEYDKYKYATTDHGFRAMARTILDEVLQVRPEYIEHQFAHSVRDPLGRAYSRTAFLPKQENVLVFHEPVASLLELCPVGGMEDMIGNQGLFFGGCQKHRQIAFTGNIFQNYP